MTDPRAARLEELYRSHAAACLGYARTICGTDMTAAEDIVHDVFVRVLSQPEPPAPGRARAYLLTAVRNAAANLRRDAARRRRRRAELGVLRPMFDPAPDPGLAADLERMLLGLPAEQRETVYLKIWGGLTFAEIGELAGVPLQTAASRFRYGLAGLRKEMGSGHDR